MKISIITTAGNERRKPGEDGEAFTEAISCFADLADEVIVVDGSESYQSSNSKIKVVPYRWKWNWSWEQLPKALNKGLEATTGDFVIRADLDYFFHENDFRRIKAHLKDLSNFDIIDFQKHVFIRGNRYYQKGRVPICINRQRAGDAIRFGRATNTKTDLCYPIRVTRDGDVPEGLYEPHTHGKSGIPFYVYDAYFKTVKEVKTEFYRFAQAYAKYFGESKWGKTPEESFDVFIKMMQGRLNRAVYKVGEQGSISSHPKYIANKINNLTKGQFGYSNWE
jgi:glycosyltransferase involved in cell wall biosynthesis